MAVDAASKDRRRLVLSVHGINSAGQWQDDIQPVLAPHFRYGIIRYPHYRTFGALRQLLHPPWALLLVAVGIAFGFPWWLGSVALLGLLVVGAVRRRRSALDEFVRQFQEHVKGETERPLVIAHSFGTYLTGRSLHKHEFLGIDRAILVGCVLDRAFPWQQVIEVRGQARQVWNEVGEYDLVVPLAGLAALVVPHLGIAGKRGFHDAPPLVHGVDGLLARCAKCPEAGEPFVHNVLNPEHHHSDSFRSALHARNLWLPMLWGMPHREHGQFVERCGELRRLEAESLWVELEAQEAAFRAQRGWTWLAGRTLEEHVARQAELEARVLGIGWSDALAERVVTRAIRNVWTVVTAARDAEDGVADEQAQNRLRALDPRIAVMRAVRVALQRESP